MPTAQCTQPINFSTVVTSISDPAAARELPCGVTVGDVYGGRSFSDNVAAVLERRSYGGWQEIQDSDRRWTVIFLCR